MMLISRVLLIAIWLGLGAFRVTLVLDSRLNLDRADIVANEPAILSSKAPDSSL